MSIRWPRLLGAAILAEIIPIASLVGLVAIFGPTESAQAREFAARLGNWVGPLGGALATFLLAIWVARPLRARQLLHGGLLGLLVAMLDGGLLVLGSAEFRWLFVASGTGRIAAGLLGGSLAAKRHDAGPEGRLSEN